MRQPSCEEAKVAAKPQQKGRHSAGGREHATLGRHLDECWSEPIRAHVDGGLKFTCIDCMRNSELSELGFIRTQGRGRLKRKWQLIEG